jgi:dihydrofolate reductase
MSRKVGLIWAQSRNGVIGRDGRIPWDVPEDLEYFANVTRGGAVIMGRRTWESLPASVRPLPGRLNIVLTSRDEVDGAVSAASLDEALEAAMGYERVWLIGGADVLREGLSVAREAYVTEFEFDVKDGDTFAPDLGTEWVNIYNEYVWSNSKNIRYRQRRFDKIFTVK